jgi:hypothetical protein
MLTETLDKNQNADLEIITVFAPKLLRKENEPILKTYKTNYEQNRSRETKPIKTYADQNRSRKTLKPILATRQNQPELLPIKKTPPMKKPRT